MEAATAAPELDQSEPKDATEVASNDDPATVTPDQLFRFSTWVHVGPGAEECDEREDGCSNPLHFHAWCRLPNQFQHREIREKALAAKARKARQFRDPETDAYAVLEDDLDAFARRGDEAKGDIVDELLQPEWWKDYLEAQKDVQEREDEQGGKPFEHIEQDQRRVAEIEALPEDKRPKDEYEELLRHVGLYGEAIDTRQKEIAEPKREALLQRDLNDLIDELRNTRISSAAVGEFQHVYYAWSWFVGTLRGPAGERRFQSYAELESAAPEVINELQRSYLDLEQTQQVASGNSSRTRRG